MKKIGIISVVALLLLTGCVSKTTKLSKSETLFTINDFKVTDEQLYEILKQSDAGINVIQHAQNVLAKDVKDEAVMEEAKKELESLKKALGTSFELQLKAIGIETEEQFLKERIIPEMKIHTLVKKYVEENYDSLFETHKPVEAAIVEFENEDKANEAQARIKAGESLIAIAKEYKLASSAFVGEPKIYFSTDETLPVAIATFFTNVSEPTPSGVVPDVTNQKFYIVEATKTDFSKAKEDVLKAADTSSTITNEVLGKLFQNAGFKVYDKEVYDALQERFSHYFKK